MKFQQIILQALSEVVGEGTSAEKLLFPLMLEPDVFNG